MGEIEGVKMKKYLLGLAALAAMGLAAQTASAIPATQQVCGILTGGSSGGEGVDGGYTSDLGGQANEGCNVLITFNSNGSISTSNPNANGFYDSGGDDNEVGIINNTGTAISSLALSNAFSDIFGFDGDGPCGTIGGGYTFSSLGPNCGTPTDPSGYAPQGVTYSGINGSDTAGTVNFAGGIAAGGGTAWFGLEGPVSESLVVGAPGVPEPGSLMLLATGLLGLGGMLRRRVSS
jgi:hypothetical protein